MTLIATMLAEMPDLRLRVQAQHIPDQNGFCADCRDNIRWPCEVYRIAADAERRGGRGRAIDPNLPWAAPGTGSMSAVPPIRTPAFPADYSPSYPSSRTPDPLSDPLPYLPTPDRRRFY